jgi:hypothetical protein
MELIKIIYIFILSFVILVVFTLGFLLFFSRRFREIEVRKKEKSGRKYIYFWRERFKSDEDVDKWRNQMRVTLKYFGVAYILFGVIILFILLKLLLSTN